jgi:choline dehydrogenase
LITSAYFGNQQNFITGAPTNGYQYITISFALVAPLSRGTADITSANLEDPPLINPNWLTHPADQEVAIAGYKRVGEVFGADSLQPILIGPEYFPAPELRVDTDEKILDFIGESFNTAFHASSTCTMGRAGDRDAVVDSRAKVFGVQNLRVVDASAFPFMIPGHPMAIVCKSPIPSLAHPTPLPFSQTNVPLRCTHRGDHGPYQDRAIVIVRG